MRYRGENVSIRFRSSNASTGAAVTLYDANDKIRPLQPFERLVVITLTAASSTGAGTCYMYDGPASTAAQSTIILPWNEVGYLVGGTEGRACPTGQLPFVFASSTGQVDVVGQGVVVQDTTQVGRQQWREALTGHN